MNKPIRSTMLLIFAFLALMLTFPAASVKAGPIDKPNDSAASSVSNAQQTDMEGANQSECPLLLAQVPGGHRCIRHCREAYYDRLRECNEPGHRHRHRCEEWAREHEKECLDRCYREHGRRWD